MAVPEWLLTLQQLSRVLGGHGAAYPGAQPWQLTLPELGALVVAVGAKAGFKIGTEDRCYPDTQHRIDCAWYPLDADVANKATAAVAWEIDARDVQLGHLQGTFQKLRRYPYAIRVQALYTIRGGARTRQAYQESLDFQRLLIEPLPILLRTDEELLGGQLEAIVGQALHAQVA